MVKALILAGGDRSGLLPLTLNLPKPMLPVGNTPLLLFQIHRLKQAGITEVILSLPHQPRQIRTVMEDGNRFGIVLRYRVESVPLGTAGAFKRIENLVDDTTVILNGDVLADFDLRSMLAEHLRRKALTTIATSRVRNPSAYGTVEVDDGGLVKSFIERPRGGKVRTNRINAGVYIVEPKLLRSLQKDTPAFFETDVFPKLLRSGRRVLAADIGDCWYEITRPANYLQSNMDLLDGVVSKPDFAVLRRQESEPSFGAADIDRTSIVAPDCRLKPDVRIVHSVIGPGCRIEAGAFIRNSVLWPSCLIRTKAVISGAVVGRGCLIEEHAFVRPGSILGDRSIVTAHSRT